MILRPVSQRLFRRQLGRHRRYATEGTKTIFICKETFENELMQDLYAQAKEKISVSITRSLAAGLRFSASHGLIIVLKT